MHIVLNRLYQSDVQTRGELLVRDGREEIFRCKTVELPWRKNKNRVSCIPTGEYAVCHRSAAESGSFGYPHFHIKGVPGRSYILIHRGNLYTQILGCVLVGREFVDINNDGHPDVTHSTDTLKELRDKTEPKMEMSVQRGWRQGFESMRAEPVKEPDWEPMVAGLESKGVEIPDHIPDRIDT